MWENIFCIIQIFTRIHEHISVYMSMQIHKDKILEVKKYSKKVHTDIQIINSEISYE